MGKIGYGYGSEWHLLRFMGRHRKYLTARVLQSISQGTHIDWLDFDFNTKRQHFDSELKGLSFLKGSAYNNIHNAWKNFWPQTGNPPNWDGVGWLGDNQNLEKPAELLLVEAKAHIGELKQNCKAEKSSRRKIQIAINTVKNGIGIKVSSDWLNGYYQHANRIATLWFLINNGLPARLVFIYFIGDPHLRVNCPTIKQEWNNALLAQEQHLGLISGHKLDSYIHKVFLDVTGK